jgi:hypothetical protein
MSLGADLILAALFVAGCAYASALVMTPTMQPHAQARSLRKSPAGTRAFGLGVRVGYWPCLCAPYVQATVLFWQIDVWFGLSSYKHEGGV